MTTVIINEKSQTGRMLLKNIKHHSRVAYILDERDNTPLPVPEEELISLNEFKKIFEDAIYEDLGQKITL